VTKGCLAHALPVCGRMWRIAQAGTTVPRRGPDAVADTEYMMYKTINQLERNPKSVSWTKQLLKLVKNKANWIGKLYSTGEIPGMRGKTTLHVQYAGKLRAQVGGGLKYGCKPLIQGEYRGYVCQAKRGKIRFTCKGITHRVHMQQVVNSDCGPSIWKGKNGRYCSYPLHKPIHKEVVCQGKGGKRDGPCTVRKAHDCLPGLPCDIKEDNEAMLDILDHF